MCQSWVVSPLFTLGEKYAGVELGPISSRKLKLYWNFFAASVVKFVFLNKTILLLQSTMCGDLINFVILNELFFVLKVSQELNYRVILPPTSLHLQYYLSS